MKSYLIAAAAILAGCGGNDATSPGGGNSITPPSRSLSATAGTSLSGFLGNYLPAVPQVTLSNAQGHPIAGVQVTFAAQGGGSVIGAVSVTDSSGHAQPRSWRLGATGAQSVTATASGAAPVTIHAAATAPPPSSFRIEVRYAANTNPTLAQRAAFDAAAARWSQLILQGGAPTTIQEFDAGCGDLRGQTVDGLVITAEFTPIDGAGKVLGSAGPCILREQGYLPVQGYMQFDTSDLGTLETAGQLDQVILHEMGHVLGFGTIWDFNPGTGFPPNMFLERSLVDPYFTGGSAMAALIGTPGGMGFSRNGVPVEASGGGGTANAHWRESTFGSELMTGWLDASTTNSLSAVTVNQFRDLGYVVDDAGADSYSLAAMIQAAGGAGQPIALVEGTLPMPIIIVNRGGREVGRVSRLFR